MARQRLPSDIGGTIQGQPIDLTQSPAPDWKRLHDGVRAVLRKKGMFRSHEGRRAAEDLGHDLYRQLSYHERKVLATEAVLVERELIRPEEMPALPAGIPPVRQRRSSPEAGPAPAAGPEPRFAVGDPVRVRDHWPAGHNRTPGYVRGKRGRVVGVHGPYPNPEALAYGDGEAPRLWLYTLEFDQGTLWEGDCGQPGDRVRLDVYEHWIEEDAS